MESEINIRHEPYKEIVIMECMRFPTPDDLARFANIVAGGKPAGLYWVGGVAFLYYPLPTTTNATVKALVEQKRVYWTFVSFALMPQYRPVIETKEKIMVPVIDMTPSSLFQRVAEWLRERK